MRTLIMILLLTAFTPAAVGAQPRLPEFGRFDSAVREGLRRDPIGGASFGIVRGGKLIASGHVGYADQGRKTRPDNRTIYRIGSISKTLTAIMLMQLVERGRVRLSDPVDHYLPEVRQMRNWPDRTRPITLMQLVTHTAGIAAEPDRSGFDKGRADAWEKQLLAALSATRVEYEPGTRFSYSNVGFAILAAALARAAGESYPRYVKAHILLPLGMTQSSFSPPTDRAHLARGYQQEKAGASNSGPQSELDGRGYKLPVGGLFTTLPDMARLVAFQMGDGPTSVLKSETLKLQSRLLKTVDLGMGEGYGAGFQLFTNGNVVLQGHAGGLPGYRALEVFDRESATGFVVLRNSVGGRFGDPVFMVFSAYGEAQ